MNWGLNHLTTLWLLPYENITPLVMKYWVRWQISISSHQWLTCIAYYYPQSFIKPLLSPHKYDDSSFIPLIYTQISLLHSSHQQSSHRKKPHNNMQAETDNRRSHRWRVISSRKPPSIGDSDNTRICRKWRWNYYKSTQVLIFSFATK